MHLFVLHAAREPRNVGTEWISAKAVDRTFSTVKYLILPHWKTTQICQLAVTAAGSYCYAASHTFLCIWQRVDAVEAAHEANPTPATPEEFRMLLAGSPNSSFLWCQFMAFWLFRGQIEKARQVAELALTTINFREEQEIFNVWVAYLNLESQHGVLGMPCACSLHALCMPWLGHVGDFGQWCAVWRACVAQGSPAPLRFFISVRHW